MENVKKMDIIGAEVYKVLKSLPQRAYEKIPADTIKIFEQYNYEELDIDIDFSKSFAEQKISKEAKDIIFWISYNYWLTDNQRQEVKLKLEANEQKLKDKYDIEKLFEKNSENQSTKIQQEEFEKQVQMVEYKKSFVYRVLNKIKSFFRK